MKKIVFTAAIGLGIAGMAMAQKSETIEGNGIEGKGLFLVKFVDKQL